MESRIWQSRVVERMSHNLGSWVHIPQDAEAFSYSFFYISITCVSLNRSHEEEQYNSFFYTKRCLTVKLGEPLLPEHFQLFGLIK